MSIRLSAAAVVIALLAAACGGDGDPYTPPNTPATAETATPALPIPTATPQPPATELRVAFINLLHPLTLDPEDVTADQTLDQRLASVIVELQAFQPDIVAVVEASWTEEHGNVVQTLARELRMEPLSARANPWLPNYTDEELLELAEQAGFWEGVAILASSRYPILGWEQHDVIPRPAATENRIVLHLVIRGPEQLGQIDLYVTQLTSGDDESHSEQAADVLAFVQETRGTGTAIVFGDLNELPDSQTVATFTGDGIFVDALGGLEPPLAGGTCCREAVVGEQAALEGRTSYVLTNGWLPGWASLFGEEPFPLPDGTLLYASDHNGLLMTFPLEAVSGRAGGPPD
ncbi:MAG: hypothetical protein WEC33_04815 [Dehalococcoidia bacterium]